MVPTSAVEAASEFLIPIGTASLSQRTDPKLVMHIVAPPVLALPVGRQRASWMTLLFE